MSKIFQNTKKERRLAPPLSCSLSELRFWWTADPPRPSQLRPSPPCSASQVRSRVNYSRLSFSTLPPKLLRLSQGTAYPSRVTLVVRPIYGRVRSGRRIQYHLDTLPFSVALQRFPAGRPSGSGLRLTGDQSYSRYGFLSNMKRCNLGKEIHNVSHQKFTSC